MKIFIAFIFSCLSLGVWAQQSITATESQFVIDGTTSREELAALRNELHTHGIAFNYNPRFAPDRSLHGIEFSINGNDGALSGQGSHPKLNQQGSKIVVHLNKTTNALEITYEGER